MRFKISLEKEPKHTDVVCCVGWNNTEDVYSCGDDHVLKRWNLVTNETVKVADLPQELYPTDLHWFPRAQVVGKKQGLDLLLITSADGKFHLINRNGRIEKSVDAHKGAVLTGRWSFDGAGLLTAGEDGQVKIWSRSGMLRSTIIQSDTPIYSAAWGPDSNQVLHTLGKNLVIKHLAPNSKPNRWKAHDGLILKVAWNPSNNLIVSGGEDCRYKVWDTYGRQLFNSITHDYPITALSWSPGGGLFAVGSFNTLRLCDRVGWSYSLEKPNTGSIFNIAWSSDGTQVAGACGNGHVIFAHIIERHFLLAEKTSVYLYNYDCKLICSPRWAGMQPETLNLASISISNDTIAVRDQLDSKTVHLFEVGSARSLVDLSPLHHWVGVLEVALNQAGSALERQIAVVDRNRDLYLALVRGSLHKKLRKLAPMVQSLRWNSDTNILATVQDTNLTVWYYPMVLYADSRLLKKTAHMKDSSEFGKSPTVMSFVGNHLRVRRMDGSLVNSVISPYPTVLHGYTSASRWDDALRMCRFVRDHTLWACLAAMAVYGRELETAEEAYAAIDEVDKVFYLQNVKKIPIRAAQLAEMALLSGNVSEAENLLLQNGFVFRAIMTNLNLHNWNRALELATKHKTHVDTVLLHRKTFLESFEKMETNEKFLQFMNEVELDPEKINKKVELEYERERENG